MSQTTQDIDREPFHVVRKRRCVTAEGKKAKLVTETYMIYCQNKQYLKPPRGKALRRREAHWIVDLLNHGRIRRRTS